MTSLAHDLLQPSHTNFLATAHVKTCNYVLLSFDIVIQYIKYFTEVHLPFKRDVITVQTEVDKYLPLPNVFLETH